MYPNTPGSRFDMDYYLNKHCPFAIKEFTAAGAVKIDVDCGVSGLMPGSPAPFHAIAYITVPDIATYQSLLANSAPKVMADIPNYTDVQVQVQVSEIAVL